MKLSYWEYKTWLSNIDFTVVGSGIVGLSCAIQLKKRYPKAKIIVLEKGMLPQGASTKNAGFACFGSISEILSDLESHSEEEVVALVEQRYQGIQWLRSSLGDRKIGFQQLGGHELFLSDDETLFEGCLSKLEYINGVLKPVFGESPFELNKNIFNYTGIRPNYITHRFEGQIDTGQMMQSLLQNAYSNGIHILNGIQVKAFQDGVDSVTVSTKAFEFKTRRLCIATNGFASQFMKEAVRPARAQVVITKPIENLHIKGTFHFDEGYYYFRNIDGRILFGGGRNLDFKTEETIDLGQTKIIQTQLERLLKEVILPDMPYEIDRRWSGIMGVGQQKKPIIKQLSENVFCGVRLGGMGVAIGSLVGKELADLV